MAENKTREELLTQKLIEQNQRELQAELDELKKRDIKNSKFNEVENMLRDKTIASQSEFIEKGAKQAGISAGYVAQEDGTGNIFILKQFYKTHNECLKIKDQKQQTQAINDRRDGVQELIGSTMYQFLLYDQAPKEELVKPDKEHQNSLYVRSKFFNNVVQLAEFSGLAGATRVRADDKNLKKLEGFEKVIAACHMLGEGDYHAGNLMVQDGKTVNKIDHGRSFIIYHQDFGAMVQSTSAMFSYPGVGYGAAIKAGNLSFSINKYSESLNQMIKQFDEKQMEAIVDQKIDELKKSGFDPKGITGLAKFKDNEYAAITINNFDDLRKFYKDNIRENLTNMKEVAKSAEIVTKFSNVLPEFKQGGWLEVFANSPIKDPVEYAAHNNIQIEGKNALDWAYENDYQIKVSKGSKQEIVQEQQWQKNPKGEWEQKEVSVTKNTRIIQNLDPAAAMRTQDKVVGEKLESLVHDFTKQVIGKEVSDKKVEEFYDKVISKLKKEQYLTDQDINIIKSDPDYKKNIEDTTKLINLTTPDLIGKDKVYYKMANFCKKIGLSNISNYFVEKISSDNLTKLYKTESIIEESVKIGNTLLKHRGKEGIQTKRLEAVKKTVQTKLEDRTRGKKLQTRL